MIVVRSNLSNFHDVDPNSLRFMKLHSRAYAPVPLRGMGYEIRACSDIVIDQYTTKSVSPKIAVAIPEGYFGCLYQPANLHRFTFNFRGDLISAGDFSPLQIYIHNLERNDDGETAGADTDLIITLFLIKPCFIKSNLSTLLYYITCVWRYILNSQYNSGKIR